MAIYLKIGRPGSGKSLRTSQEILKYMLFRKRVIANYELNAPKKYMKNGRAPLYWVNEQMTVKNFMAFARQHHKPNKESQTLVVIDECHLQFAKDRMTKKEISEWLDFFSRLHRKSGFDFIFMTQSKSRIQKDIADLCETVTMHFKMDNCPSTSLIFLLIYQVLKLFRIKLFVAITEWEDMPGKMFRHKKLFTFRRKYANLYNCFEIFEPLEAVDGVTQDAPTSEREASEEKRIEEQPDMSAYVQELLDAQLAERYDLTAFGVRAKATEETA